MATPRGFGIAVSLEPETIRKSAEAVESRGYASFWSNNTPGSDGLQALRTASRATSSIKLGVGVIPVHRHPAEEIIQRTGKGTGDEIPMNRLLLGIGAAGEGALQLIRDNIAALRAELDCEIYMAALGPRMCRLAGELADGVLFNWLTPEYARTSADHVQEGARAAGRSTPQLMTYVRVALREEGRQRLQKEAARYESIPAYAKHFERMGASGLDASVTGDDRDAIQQGLREWDGVLDEIVVRSITPNDTLDETLELVDAAAP